MHLPTKFLHLAALATAVLLSGCGEMKMKAWPFSSEKSFQERARGPANATEYQCAGGKRIYLRTMDGGDSVWLILPERELRLDRIGAEGSRYGKGAMVLQLSGNDATLTDGAASPFAGCRTGTAEPSASSGENANK